MWKRFAIGGALVVVLAASATATAGFLEVKHVADALNLGGPKIRCDPALCAPTDPGKPQTILMLGSDRRYIDKKQGNPSRSDTIMLVRLDPSKEATTLMSIPRDLKVQIPTARGYVTDKINDAYALGGPKLTLRVLKELLGIEINHVVNINFFGFRKAVDKIGCVYADIDRRYFNDNTGPGPDYATINIEPGYQRLCGRDALDYVRFRHEDTDIVRAARQQDFLRQAKQQVSTGKLFHNREELLKIFGRYTQTDIRGSRQVLRLLELGILSAGHPVEEVHFNVELGPSYVTAHQGSIQKAVHQFLEGKSSKGPRGRLESTRAERRAARHRKRHKQVAAGLEDARRAGEDQAITIANQVPFPVYYPRLRTRLAIYATPTPRVYRIRDLQGRRHRAYRMVIKKGILGEYYGLQGMNWMNPPILANPDGHKRIHGRRFDLFYDGSRLRLVSWRSRRAVYWISNTLLQTLTKRQMLDIAASTKRIGR